MSANITVNIADFTQEPLAVTKVRITPVFTHTISGDSIITADRVTKVTDATGIVVFENVVIGTYTAELLGPYKTTSLTFVVAESGDLNLKDLIDTPATLPDGDVAYSKAAADAKFALKTELLAYDFGTDFYVVDNDVSLSATVKNSLALLTGVSSNVQDQLNTKATMAGASLTGDRAVITDATGKLTVSAVTPTELGYLSGVTSGIQTQLNSKAPLSSPTFTGLITISGNVIAEGEINTNDLVVVGTTDLQGSVTIPSLFTRPQRYVSDNLNIVIVEGGHAEINGTYNLEETEYVQSVWPFARIRWNDYESYHEFYLGANILYYGGVIQGSQEIPENTWQIDQGDEPTPGFVHYQAVYDNPYTFDNIVVKNSDIIGASNVVNLAYIDNYGAGFVTKDGWPGYLTSYANSRTVGDSTTYTLNASTGTITVNKAGVYKVSLQGGFATVSGDYIFQLRVNGSQHSRHGFRLLTSSTAGYGTYKQVVLHLNANSSLRWYLETGPNANFTDMQFMVEALR